MRPRFCSYLLLSIIVSLSIACPLSGEPAVFHAHTDWLLKASLKYDTLCLLNVLSNDPYYLHYYQAEYNHFHPMFTPAEQDAFVQLKRIFKDEGGGIISATLTLYYSTVADETLPEMIETAKDSSKMEAALRKTTYWDTGSWKRYEKARPSLVVALSALNRVDFPAYWAQTAKPQVEQRIAELAPALPNYDIVPDIERHLGFPLPSRTITVFLLNYSEPHGIRITGLQFLTHVSYPFRIVLRNAIHESMHPPYRSASPDVAQAIALLGSDPLIADKVKHHNASFGYNTAQGYIEEDSVQALEEIISEDVGVGQNACEYWKDQDEGMHVLATAIYTDYKAAYTRQPQAYGDWFVKSVANGLLRGDDLRTTVADFFSSSQCAR